LKKYLVGIITGGLFVAGAILGLDGLDGAGAASTKVYVDESSKNTVLFTAKQTADLDAVISAGAGCDTTDPVLSKLLIAPGDLRWTAAIKCFREIKSLADVPASGNIQVYTK